MTEKRFQIKKGNLIFDGDEYISRNEVIDRLNEQAQTIDEFTERITHDYETITKLQSEKETLTKENFELKQALLYFLDCATFETSVQYDKDMEIMCQALFKCSYEEAEKKYGGDEFYEKLREIDDD